METAVIIANWNGKKLLLECLESLENQIYKDFKIIVVDNGSTDGSVEFLENKFPEIKTIKLDKNNGFAIANNIGIQEALRDERIKYIIALNNDTKADSKYLSELVKEAKKNQNIGSCQPKVLNFYDLDTIDSTGILIYKDCSAINRGQKEKDIGQYEIKEEIFGASASAALYSRKALEDVKLVNGDYFDSDYFAYYEDVDLAWRLRLYNYSSYYIPSAIVYHIHSATGINYSPFKAYNIHRNQYYNIIKNMPGKYMWLALAFMPIRYLLLIVSVIKKKGPSARLSANKELKGRKLGIVGIVLSSWMEIIKRLPETLKKRRYIQNNKKVLNSEVGNWLKKYKADIKKIIYQ